MLDGAQAGTLLFGLSDEVLRNRLADRDEAALTLVTRFGLDRLRDMIARLLAVRAEIDWPLWSRETPEGLVGRWEDFWRRDTVPRILRQISESAAAQTVLDLAMRYPPAHPKMRERCDLLLDQLPKLESSTQPTIDLAALREAAKVQGGGTKKDWVSEQVYGRFRDAAKALRDAIDEVESRLQFDPAAARPAAAMALELLGLAADVAGHYDRTETRVGRARLRRPADPRPTVARRPMRTPACGNGWRRRSGCCWSTSSRTPTPRQVEMLKALCDNEYLRGKLFFVGDYKQSIYRFRGAEPDVFRQLRGEVPAAGRMSLTENFRSQPAVLEFVNSLFRRGAGARLRAASIATAASQPHAGGRVPLGVRKLPFPSGRGPG